MASVEALSAIRRHESSYVDPHGFLFHDAGGIFRAIYPAYAAFYRRLIEDGRAKQWQDEQGLVGTEIVESARPELSDHLVLRHDYIRPATYCTEWTPSALQRAALATLDLGIAIADDGLTLQDAYPWNVLFRGTSPVFVDFTSVAIARPDVIWPASDQFVAFFKRPLVLASRGRGRIARALLLDAAAGITRDDYLLAAGPLYAATHPGEAVTLWVERRLADMPRLMRWAADLATGYRPAADSNVRKSFLRRLRSQIAGLSFERGGDPWEAYYATLPPYIDRHAKLQAIENAVASWRPTTAIDLGANTGVYSLMMARRGCSVVAIDGSEACMERLYHLADAEKLNLLPLVGDVLAPTPGFGFLGRQFPPLFERLACELCLCLGLMHHLYVTGRQSLERIADLVSAASTRYLAFEYIDPSDANMPLIGGSRAAGYTLADVMKALSRHFIDLSVVPSDRQTRSIILGVKR